MKNFEKSQSELKWIRDESRKNDEKRSEWVDLNDSNSYDEDDENSVDHWYNKYRKSECVADHANGGRFLKKSCHAILNIIRSEFQSQSFNFFRIENIEWLLRNL